MLRFLLLQVRNADDPMRAQEVRSFARALEVDPQRIVPFDLLTGVPKARELKQADIVLLGGSGAYSATGDDAFVDLTLDFLRDLCEQGHPTFASCWGFQAMARALGGAVETRPDLAEIGSIRMRLTAAGQQDPVFGSLPPDFHGQAGHQDSVVRLPEQAVLLASSEKVTNQAYRIEGRPIYCTQFHPELNRDDLLIRVLAYPEYIERIAGLPAHEFGRLLIDTLETEALLRRFVRHYFP